MTLHLRFFEGRLSMSRNLLAVVAATLLLSTGQVHAQAGHHHGATASSETERMATASSAVQITDAFGRATLPKAPVGGVYLTLVNAGAEEDRLIAASSPAAEKLTLHDIKMVGDVMKMSELAEAEAALSADQIALYNSFNGTMMVDEGLI